MHAKRNRWLTNSFTAIFFLGFFLLSACGGGSSNPPPPPPGTTAPSGLSYQTPQAFTIGQAITALSPTVTGTVSSYSVSPTLPAGLAISATTGVISGTPTAVAAQAKYTVTATNSGGSTTADLMIAVNDVKPQQMSYSASTVAMTTGLQITPLVPTASGGGAVVNWSISPALPAGLSFSTTDGSISGTPTAASAATAYTVTASNSGGQVTFTLTLSVQSAATVFDLGHAAGIQVLRLGGGHVFSVDLDGHWVLWDYASGAELASGDSSCKVSSPPPCSNNTLADFAGQTIAIETPTGFEIRSSADGHVIATIATTANDWWKLAVDGTYLVAGGATGLKAWSSAGATLFSKSVPIVGPQAVFPASGVLRVATVVGGLNVVESTTVASGMSTDSAPFNGTFQTWYFDGSSFLTSASNTVLTYSAAVVQQGITPVQQGVGQLVGTGGWFGNSLNGLFSVYKVGASAAAATYSLSPNGFSIFPTATSFVTLGIGDTFLTVIDLSGAAPVRTDLPLPTGGMGATAYAAASPTQWLVGTGAGVLFDGASSVATPRYLGWGAALSIAGSGSRFAISTASARVLVFDAATQTLELTIPQLAGKVLLSADGTVLAAVGSPNTKVYSLPGGGVLSTWPSAGDTSLSASGAVLGRAFLDGTAQANPVTGGSAILTVTQSCVGIRLSPNGSHAACNASMRPGNLTTFTTTNATQLYTNGALVSALAGLGVGWLDDGHLFVNNYQLVSHDMLVQSSGQSIFSATGVPLSTATLPELHEVQTLTADSIYSAQWNSIFSVSTSATTWTSADPSRRVGGVAGSNVVFVSGTQVLALPH